MKLYIAKNKCDGTYTLDINSGHFSGELCSISKEKIIEIRDSINSLLTDDVEFVKTEIVWNPRSQRHETRPVDCDGDE